MTTALPDELRQDVTRLLSEMVSVLTDDPVAVPVDVFVERWDRLWGDGRRTLREGLGDIRAILEAPGIEVTPEMLHNVTEMLQIAANSIDTMSDRNAPTYEQRMEARAIRIERKLDELLERGR